MTIGGNPRQGKIIGGKYRLDLMAARGGMGELWKAEELATGRPVALKCVATERSSDPEQLQRRLQREARALEAIEHPNVVRHLDAGVDEHGDPYLVLEWLEGENLFQRQRRAPLKLKEATSVAQQVLQGLVACHARGVVHRDVKPGNIFLLEEGGALLVKLIDFGLAIVGEEETRLTRAGDVLGTLHYLSPEQARGAEKSDHRSDIYSTGVVLYELITGRQPFRAEKALAVLLKIVTEQPPRLRQFRPDAPTWLEEVVLRAMARDADHRYPSAETMIEALQRPLRKVTVSASPAAENEEAMAQTLPPWHPYAPEYRLVSLLCVLPTKSEAGSAGLHDARCVLERAQAHVFRLMGGQFVGVFGLDQTRGDETSRAVSCGLSVAELLGDRVRLLVASVHLLYGEGLQLNSEELDRSLADLSAAPAGELVIDETSRELLRNRVRAKKRGGHHVVTGVCSSDLSHRPVLGVFTPTVGRDAELAQAHELFRRTIEEREPRGLLIVGQAGRGKTRLCADLADMLRREAMHFMEVRGSSIRRLTSYGLLAEGISAEVELRAGDDESSRLRALRSLVHRNVPLEQRDEVTLFLGEALGIPVTPETMRWSSSSAEQYSSLRVARSNPQVMRARVAEATKQLLASAAAAGPLALLVEDLHWADDESLQLLSSLLEIEGVPLFVLATARPELLQRRAVLGQCTRLEEIELSALDDEALRRLLRSVLGDIAPAHEERMLRWCDGSPYFAEELVSFLVAHEQLVFAEGGWRLADDGAELVLPISIEGAIQGQLDRLRPEQKELLKQASVFGEIFWEAGLEALGIAAPKELLPKLEELALLRSHAGSLLPQHHAWAFRHGALRQVAYGLLPASQRRELHRRAAEWLESQGERDPGVLAHHYAAAGERKRAASNFEKAGQRALAEGDLRCAAICLEAALDNSEAEDDEQRLARIWSLVRISIMRGDPDRAEDLLEQLERKGHLEGDEHAAEAAFHRGRIALVRARYDTAQGALREAIEAYGRAGNADQAFEALHTLFWAVWTRGRYQDAGELAERMHREASPSRPDHLCSAKLASTFYNITYGDLAAALALSEQAVRHARQAKQRIREIDALIICAVARELVGDYRAALKALAEAEEISERLRTPHHAMSLHGCFGRIRFAQGDYDDALEHYERAEQHATALGDERSLLIARCGKARALARRGKKADLEQSSRLASAALESIMAAGTPEEAEAQLAKCEVELARDAPDSALRAADAAVALLDRLGTHEHLEVEILLAAYRARERSGEANARDQLERACRVVKAKGERISVKEARLSFLERVPHNKQVRELWRALTRA